MSPSTLRSVMLAALVISALPAWSHSTSSVSSTEAEIALKKAFESYCNDLSPDPEKQKQDRRKCIENGLSPAKQYLTLEAACTGGGASSPPAVPCQEFEDAKKKAGHETLEPLVLALNHQTGRWRTSHRLSSLEETRVKWDVAGEPVVSLAKNERITVVVENTNPLLYGAIAGKPTEENVPELAEIQKLLAKFGGGLTSLIAVAAANSTKAHAAGGLPELAKYTTLVQKVLDDVQASFLVVECRAGQIVGQTGRAVTFTQALELGVSSEYHLEPPNPANCSSLAVSRIYAEEVARAFGALQLALFSPQDHPEDCVALLDAARAVVTSDPADPVKVRAAISQFEKITTCSVADLVTALKEMVAEVEKPLSEAEDAVVEMRVNAPKLKLLEALATPTPDQKDELKKLRKEKAEAEQVEGVKLKAMRIALADEGKLEQRLLDAANLGRELVSIRKDGEEILAKRDEVQKAAAQVEVFGRRLDQYRIRRVDQCGSSSTVDCVMSDSLDTRLILDPQFKDVRQTKIQKHSLTVKPDSPYAPKIVATRPAELKGDYSLDSVLRGLWGISASVIYTELANKTFGAVTSEDDPEKKVIAVTDETTRAGEIALLADFRLARWALCRKASSKCGSKANWFGLEVGAGIGDDPAFFGGISLRPSRSWRLGVGYTYQQVSDLQRGLSLGQEVADADDIRTRDRFEGKWYISLSFALDSLRLFSSGD